MSRTVRLVAIALLLAVIATAIAIRGARRASRAVGSSDSALLPPAMPPPEAQAVSRPTQPTGAPATGGTPRLVELGSLNCVSCKMMMPILKELKKDLAGRVEVEVIDVGADPAAAKTYRIRVIPTQVFQDASGRELWRHEGII